jgi:hypothetical protein
MASGRKQLTSCRVEVRYESEADLQVARQHVRFVPLADVDCLLQHLSLLGL